MKILIVIDLQKDFILEPYYSQALEFIKEHKKDYDKVIATRFVNTENSAFTQKLDYYGAMEKTALEFSYDELFSKHTYDCGDGFYKHMKDAEIDVIGCDTDACVLAMCFEMFRLNLNFHIIADFCYSSGGDEYHNMALDIMYRNFGADCIIEHGTYIQQDEEYEEETET
jgi:nicotinamidase-related amidase